MSPPTQFTTKIDEKTSMGPPTQFATKIDGKTSMGPPTQFTTKIDEKTSMGPPTPFATKIDGKTSMGPPVILLCNIFIPSYMFGALLCRNWTLSPLNRETFTHNSNIVFENTFSGAVLPTIVRAAFHNAHGIFIFIFLNHMGGHMK
jgi:hypothetical protein